MNGLQIDGVSVRFGATIAVDGVSLEVPSGQVLSILGPSGCGKSTLLRVVAGLQPVDVGRVFFDGDDMTTVPTHRRRFGLMFQDGQLFGHLNVGDNVAYPLKRQHLPREARRARVAQLLDLVGLGGLEKRPVSTLSGGQQQRVALARALAPEPRLLLLDEPLSALDRDLRERLAADLRSILRSTSTTALLVTHDHDEALTVGDRLAVMTAGRIVQQGMATDVWRAPIDAEVGRLLGYRTRIAASAWAAAGLAENGDVLLRDNAFRVSDEGLSGVVQEVRATSSGVALMVGLEHLGVVPAVGDDPTAVRPGDTVRVALNPTAVAVLPANVAGVTSPHHPDPTAQP